MIELAFSKYLIQYWLLGLLFAIKALRNKEFRKIFVSSRPEFVETPELDSSVERFLEKRKVDHLKNLMSDKEVAKRLSTGKTGVGNSRLDPDYISKLSEIYWLLIIFLIIVFYIFSKYLTAIFFESGGGNPSSLGGTFVEVANTGDALTFFIAPVFSLFLPAPTLCLLSSKVIPYLFRKGLFSTSFFYGCTKHLTMTYPIFRNISMAIGLVPYLLYVTTNFQITSYGRNEIVVKKIFQKEILYYKDLSSFRVYKDNNKISEIHLSFGENGYVKTLQEDSTYYGDKSKSIERDLALNYVYENLKLVTNEIEKEDKFDLHSGKKEYTKAKLYFDDYLTRIFLFLLVNSAAFCLFMLSGSWFARFLGLND